jgi:serine/threonine protein kinase
MASSIKDLLCLQQEYPFTNFLPDVLNIKIIAICNHYMAEILYNVYKYDIHLERFGEVMCLAICIFYRFCQKYPEKDHKIPQAYLLCICALSLEYVFMDGDGFDFKKSAGLIAPFDKEELSRKILILLDFNLILATPYYFFKNFMQNDELFENNRLIRDRHKTNLAFSLLLFNMLDTKTISKFNTNINMSEKLALDCIFNAYGMSTMDSNYLNISIQNSTEKLKPFRNVFCVKFNINQKDLDSLKPHKITPNYPKFEIRCDKPKTNITTNNVENLEIIKVLGQGAYGKVELITIDNAEYAMKTFLFNLFPLPQSTVRELSLLKYLNHPNVISADKIIIKERSTHAILPLMASDLGDYIHSNAEPIPEKILKSICKQFLSGLAYLHERMIYHRDLKPANTLIEPVLDLVNKFCKTKSIAYWKRLPKSVQLEFQKGVKQCDDDSFSFIEELPLNDLEYFDIEVKIADLGLAKWMINKEGRLTPGDSVVTLPYRAPEQLFVTNYTDKADMWSAGCIFAEMIRKERLFSVDSAMNLILFQFKFLGVPKEDTWIGIDALKESQFLSGDFPNWEYSKEHFESYFPAETNPLFLDLLSKMLVLNPENRISARNALRHDYFK